ncbi:restriction endonuclease subunit S [Rhizobium helianthi]|uniref:Restriction endonuclease subunit S n=1 Tax=Rhizobium helianthi TaxID=1132695 RepID=A0ABW4M8D0_9HYPH
MSVLPRGWVATSLSEISGGITYGFTTKSNAVSDGVRLLRITDIQDYKVDWDSLPFCDDQPDPAFLVKGGDIVVARTGATTGKSYLIKNVPVPTAFASYLIRIAVSHELQSDYVWKFMQGPDYWQQIQVVSKGTAQPGANAVILGQVAIPLPPLAEQKRIVAKLDALNAKSARARIELARIESLVSRYKQAVLSKAFSGELTPRHGGKATIQFNPKLATQIDGRTPELPALPATWSWVALSSVAEVSGGLTKNSKRDSLPLQVPYLRVANVYANELRLDDVSFIGCTENEVARTTLMAGDLLLVEGNGSLDQIGRVALWSGELDQCVHQNHLIKVRPGEGLESKFALYWLLSPLGRRAIEAVAASSSGLHTLSLSKVGGLPLPLCNLEEQHEIVRRIESAFAKIDRLAKEAKRALELVGRLDEAILAKAFRGELVPQDENDEPAEHLLARIRAEREAAPKGKRGRGTKA